MSSEAKRNLWHAVERYGLPTVFCAVLWYGFRADAATTRTEVITRLENQAALQQRHAVRMAEVTATTDDQNELLGRLTETVASLQREQVRFATRQEQRTGVFEQITARLEKLGERVNENDRRITRREDNRFTAQDGTQLSSSVARNSATIAQQADRLELLREDVAKLRQALGKVWTAITSQTKGR